MGKVVMSGIVPKLEAPSNFPPIGTALNDMTWEEIRIVSDDGLASNYFSVGDTKTIIINGKVGATTFSSLTIDVFILGIDHNASVEGSNRIHFGIGKINGVDVCLCDGNYYDECTTSGYFSVTTGFYKGGWESCHMRSTILGSDSDPINPTANTLLAALPSDLRAVMKPITKYSDNIGDGQNTASSVTATTDYLWLLSEFEVQGARTYANKAEQNKQKQYDYYKAGNSKSKYKHTDTTGAVVNWWLRSVNGYDIAQFGLVNGNGSASYTNAYESQGVAPAFAV